MSDYISEVTRKRALSVDDVDVSVFKRNTSSSTNTIYKKNDKALFLCDDGLYYQIKIIGVEDIGYTIHYHGYNDGYNEFISKKDAQKRFKLYTEEAAREAKEAKIALKEAPRQQKSQAKPAKRERSFTSSSSKTRKSFSVNVKKLKSSLQNERIKKLNSELKDVFDNLLTKDLALVLCDEYDKISNSNAVPKIPVEHEKSIEQILNEYLESKGYKVDKFEASIKNTKDFKSNKFDLPKRLVFFVHLFNKKFMQRLVYDKEKPIFEQLGNEDKEKDSSEQFTRHSAYLGFTHLLRFIHRLPEILMPNDELTTGQLISNVSKFVSTAQDLCDYLEENVARYYNIDTYYESSER